MTTGTTPWVVRHPAQLYGQSVTVVWIARLVGAGLLGAIAGIHLHLWLSGYRGIPTIGPLFMVDVVVAAVLAIAVLTVPRRLLAWAAAAGALTAAGTLGGLVLSLTVGLFGFQESLAASLVVTTIVVESAAVGWLGITAAAGVLACRS